MCVYVGSPKQHTTLKSVVEGDKSATLNNLATDEVVEKRKEGFTDTSGNGNHSFMVSPVFFCQFEGIMHQNICV